MAPVPRTIWLARPSSLTPLIRRNRAFQSGKYAAWAAISLASRGGGTGLGGHALGVERVPRDGLEVSVVVDHGDVTALLFHPVVDVEGALLGLGLRVAVVV